ncbi:MAG: helix-turn-helix domain-containing protein [Candidatus Eisenbacteria sp.]|nr:helix-turn-helix domain-containing protein [Candidatus Eisenbacteria bacterium]
MPRQNWIRKARIELGLTQGDLAAKIGVSQAIV